MMDIRIKHLEQIRREGEMAADREQATRNFLAVTASIVIVLFAAILTLAHAIHGALQ